MNVRAETAEAAAALLGEALVGAGKIDQSGLDRARRAANGRIGALPRVLSQLGLVSERDLAVALAEASGRPLIGAGDLPAEALAIEGLSPKFLRERRILPFGAGAGGFDLAMADPFDRYSLDAFRMAAGREAVVFVAEPGVIEKAIGRIYGEAQAPEVEIEGPAEELELSRLKDLASEAPVIQLVNGLIAEAVEERASDIHLEPFEGRVEARLRVDGALRKGPEVPDRMRAAVVSRIKIMAGLDIAERRLPQDGRVKTVVRGRSIDLRISTLPILHGESVVIRVLDRESVALDFDALGLAGAAKARVLDCLARPNGIFLVTGPTGSGKTTTLYAALTHLHSVEKKMLTVEDPVEYQIGGVNQVQVRPGIGLDFARVLRSMLRQDPDVIMVGEIRDGETARIAAQSALTGHLVLSTLHTNDAAGAVTRLLDMGLEPFLLTATLSGVAAQRLVRRLCPECREGYAPSPELAAELGLAGAPTLYRPKGCAACGGRGYRGRVMITEVLEMTDRLRDLVLAQAGDGDLRAAAVEEGMVPLFDDGLAKALAGVCSIEDVFAAARLG